MVWPHVKDWIDGSRPKAPELYTLDEIRADAVKGEMAIWAVCEGPKIVGVMVTCPIQYPRFKSIRLWIVGGNGMERWGKQAHEYLNAFAKEHGVAWIEGGGRNGWKRGFGEVHDLGPVLFLAVR